MAQIVNDRFEETDVIRQAERGLTFITHAESDRQYITGKDSVGTLSWTTINATAVYLDGTEVDINGTAGGGSYSGNHSYTDRRG